jgi:hypothetical protein
MLVFTGPVMPPKTIIDVDLFFLLATGRRQEK